MDRNPGRRTKHRRRRVADFDINATEQSSQMKKNKWITWREIST